VTGNQRVLVAEDDLEMLDAVAEAFARRNYDVVRAKNGAELVEQLANHGPFDLIVADVSMPWMDGLKGAEFHARSRLGDTDHCDDGAERATVTESGAGAEPRGSLAQTVRAR